MVTHQCFLYEGKFLNILSEMGPWIRKVMVVAGYGIGPPKHPPKQSKSSLKSIISQGSKYINIWRVSNSSRRIFPIPRWLPSTNPPSRATTTFTVRLFSLQIPPVSTRLNLSQTPHLKKGANHGIVHKPLVHWIHRTHHLCTDLPGR